ncbi:collagen triple helix repeat-containing protein, partial [Myroides odoratus DSM 2801]
MINPSPLINLVKANETVTTLLANTDGTYTYKSENGTETIIDIPASVANNFETIVNTNPEKVKEIIEKVAKDVEGNVTYNGTDLVYKDGNGDDQIINLDQLVKANETVTTLLANTDGTYTYKSENGTETIIDIPASVANNFETIVNNNPEKVKEIIEQVAKDVEGNVTYNGTDLLYKDAAGADQVINLDQLVKANETVTTLLANTDGTYTYKSENGTETIIDIPASVANNFETIVNNNPEKVKEIIEKVAKDVEGNVTYNGTDLVYKDATGNDQVINLDQLVKANETVTTLLANTDGTYTYKSENGTETIIDIPASVANNFETIVNNNPEKVKEIIEKVAKDVEGNVTYNGTDLLYKDATGADQVINLDQLVKANETVTTLLANTDGTYTYKSENGTETIIDIPASVANNFETIVNNNPEKVKEIIEQVAKDVEGNVTYNGTDLVYKDGNGDDQVINLEQLVKANETVTTLLANTDGTYTYKSEN